MQFESSLLALLHDPGALRALPSHQDLSARGLRPTLRAERLVVWAGHADRQGQGSLSVCLGRNRCCLWVGLGTE